MKALARPALLVVAATVVGFSVVALAVETGSLTDPGAPMGTIVATTTKNNSDTAVPFTIPQSVRVLIQCDTAAYVRWGAATTVTSTTATGLLLEAGEKWETTSGDTLVYLAAVAVAGTSNCKVYRVQ